MPTLGSLFAGIGGMDLGFERAGFETAWQVEIDPWCRRILARHFPKAERFADVRKCGSINLPPVDVIAGGFPCQDTSNIGKRAGLDGDRSGLWRDFCRIIGELRPSFAVVENPPALLGRGFGRVVGDLSTIGYDAEWQIVSAADVGAPHLRERIWVVAYPMREGLQGHAGNVEGETDWTREDGPVSPPRVFRGQQYLRRWMPEPPVARVAHGISKRVERIRALGNAAVPQIPEMIARWIIEALDQ